MARRTAPAEPLTRRPLSILTALLVLLAPSLAVGAPPTGNPPVQSSIVTRANGSPPVAQIDPAIAIDPIDGLHRIVTATEGATGRIGRWSTADGGTSWAFQGDAPIAPGTVDASRSQAAWGAGATVYSSWQGRTTPGSGADCGAAAGAWLSSSTDSGQTWSAQVEPIEGGVNGVLGEYVSRGWASLTVDDSARSTAGQPLMAVEKATWTGACGVGPVARELSLVWRVVGSSGTVHDVDFTIPGVTDASNPAIVAVPAPIPTVAVAYITTPAGASAHPMIAVVRCSRDDLSPTNIFGLEWICSAPQVVSDASFALVTSIGATSAPAIAVDGNHGGALFVAYTTATAQGARVVVTASDAGGSIWTPPTLIDEPAGVTAHQLLPAIAVAANGRADVVYLDGRDAPTGTPTYAPYQTSFLCVNRDDCPAGMLRGNDVALSTGAPIASPLGAGWLLGTQLAVADAQNIPTPYTGHTIAIAPQANGLASSELWHGSRPPQIAGGTISDQPRVLAKNITTSLADWFVATDVDGDPVNVTVTTVGAPAHGAIAAGAYTPLAGFAGQDSFTIVATDGRLSATAVHPVVVVDQAPQFDAVQPCVVTEGAGCTRPVNAVDPDPGDGVTYALGYVPPELRVAQASVKLNGTTLEVSVGAGVRYPGLLRVEVVASDTALAPALPLTSRLPIFITIVPNLSVPTVTVAATAVSGRSVRLTAAPFWSDPDDGCLTALVNRCHWQLTWNTGDGETTTTTDATLVHSYAAAGYFAPTVTAQIIGYSSPVPPSAVAGLLTGPDHPGAIAVSDDARTRLYVRASGTRSGTVQLLVASRDTTTLDVTLVIAATGRRYQRSVHVVAGRAGALGAAVTTTFRIGAVRSTGATVVLGYAESLASEPPPRPLRKVFWIR